MTVVGEIAHHTADIIAFAWGFVTYIPWFVISGAGYKLSMNKRLKSREIKPAVRRAVENTVLIHNFDQQHDTLVDAFRAATARFGSRMAIGRRQLLSEDDELQPNGRTFKKNTYGDYQFKTFSEMETLVNNTAAGFASLGLKKGDKIALYMETRSEWMIAAHAAFRAGLTVVTVYASLGEDRVIEAIEESEAKALVSSNALLSKCVKPVADAMQGQLVHIINCKDENNKPCQALETVDASITITAFGAISQTDASTFEAPEVSGDDLAVIMYTSGTTGKAKGVMILHKNICAAIGGLTSRLKLSGISFDDDVYIGYLPCAHVLELAAENTVLLNGSRIGYSSPLTLSDKSAKIKTGTMGDARALRPTLMAAVPEILERIRKNVDQVLKQGSAVKQAVFKYAYNYKLDQVQNGGDSPVLNRLIFKKTRDLLGGRLKAMIAGGAPVEAKTQQFMSICMSCPLVIGYGLTETCAAGAVQDAYDISSGRVGPPLGCTEIRLIDWEEGNYTINNEPPQGEVLIGGPAITAGYFKMPEKTAEDYCEIDGLRYFKTGDIGEWDSDGALKIIDRKKDLCKMRHGEYVALGKVEAALKTSGAVANIVVYGSGAILMPIAIACPVEKVLLDWAKELGVEGDLVEICKDDKINKKMMEELQATAKAATLSKLEIPNKVHIDGNFDAGWLPDTGLVTDAFKLKRKQLNDHYADVITKLTA